MCVCVGGGGGGGAGVWGGGGGWGGGGACACRSFSSPAAHAAPHSRRCHYTHLRLVENPVRPVEVRVKGRDVRQAARGAPRPAPRVRLKVAIEGRVLLQPRHVGHSHDHRNGEGQQAGAHLRAHLHRAARAAGGVGAAHRALGMRTLKQAAQHKVLERVGSQHDRRLQGYLPGAVQGHQPRRRRHRARVRARALKHTSQGKD